ncbi:MAG: BACON domain-containing protein, partial [Deltaproteobacteria bacterium]|nr:BACON domain-containing protein [Deltaproteobacteria bacterium]
MKHRNVIAALVVAACLWVGCSSAFAADLVWQTSKADAIVLAKSQGKMILLLAGNKCCDATEFMKYTACELTSPADIKGLIERYFIPWYGVAPYNISCGEAAVTTDWNSYAPPGYFQMPLIAVIDPNNSATYLDRTVDIPRLPADHRYFDAQGFYDRLLKYTTETPATCTYNISPSVHAFNASSNTGTINVTPSSSDCPWTALSNAPWITITAGSPGTGNGTVSYSVSANKTGSTRTGTMTIGGKTFTVTQNGSTTCAYTISPTSSLFSSSPHPTPFGDVGSTGTVAVTASVSSCSWSAASNASWITITPESAGGTGDGTVSYSVSENTGSTRTGTMTIGGQTFTVTQNGATTCAYTISPTSTALLSSLGN